MSLNGTEPELDGVSEIIWPFVRDVIIHCRIKAENASKGKNNQSGSEPEANQKRIESESKTNRQLKKKEEEDDDDLKKNDDEFKRKEKEADDEKKEGGWGAPKFGTRVKAWFATCDKSEFTQRVLTYDQQFPKAFLNQFIDYYTQEHIEGGIHVNHEIKFDIESKLRKWWSDPSTREKFKSNLSARNRV